MFRLGENKGPSIWHQRWLAGILRQWSATTSPLQYMLELSHLSSRWLMYRWEGHSSLAGPTQKKGHASCLMASAPALIVLQVSGDVDDEEPPHDSRLAGLGAALQGLSRDTRWRTYMTSRVKGLALALALALELALELFLVRSSGPRTSSRRSGASSDRKERAVSFNVANYPVLSLPLSHTAGPAPGNRDRPALQF